MSDQNITGLQSVKNNIGNESANVINVTNSSSNSSNSSNRSNRSNRSKRHKKRVAKSNGYTKNKKRTNYRTV